MINIELNAAKLSIHNFCALMQSIETEYPEEFEGAIAKIAPLCNTSVEQIEELDLKEVIELSQKLKDLDLQSVIDSQVQNKFELNGVTYSVLFTEDGSISLKFNENKYLRSLLQTTVVSNALFYAHLDKIAAVLFKPEGETKFDKDVIEERAKLFRDSMPAEIIYPFIALLVKKLSQ